MAREDNPGFNRYNTIMLVNDGEAFIPAQQREIKSGDYVVLVPFSHGG
jgi:molybdopterin converting factor small subunit